VHERRGDSLLTTFVFVVSLFMWARSCLLRLLFSFRVATSLKNIDRSVFFVLDLSFCLRSLPLAEGSLL